MRESRIFKPLKVRVETSKVGFCICFCKIILSEVALYFVSFTALAQDFIACVSSELCGKILRRCWVRLTACPSCCHHINTSGVMWHLIVLFENLFCTNPLGKFIMHATVLSSYIQCLAKQIPTLYISALLFIRAEPTALRTNTSQEIYLELNINRRHNDSSCPLGSLSRYFRIFSD